MATRRTAPTGGRTRKEGRWVMLQAMFRLSDYPVKKVQDGQPCTPHHSYHIHSQTPRALLTTERIRYSREKCEWYAPEPKRWSRPPHFFSGHRPPEDTGPRRTGLGRPYPRPKKEHDTRLRPFQRRTGPSLSYLFKRQRCWPWKAPTFWLGSGQERAACIPSMSGFTFRGTSCVRFC